MSETTAWAERIAIGEVDETTMARLHARLESSPDVDVAYRVVDSPLGPLLLAATDRGLVRVGFERLDHEALLADLGERVSPRVLRAPARLEAETRQVGEYFEGRRTTFDLSLDLQLARGFRLEVIGHLPEIGYGATATYAEVAALAGRPRAVRAVGTACAANPLPLVLPCHRVVRSDGSRGQYAGGPEAKDLLLDLESGSASR